jgi:4-aminobutyrate aminotransferase-like enzyme
VKEHGVLLILDEVQTAFGRTGRLFACEHEGVVPDILCLSKSLGNGYPISATMTTDRIAEKHTRPGASTYGGNPLCATAALTVLEVVVRDNLAERARILGEFLGDGLESLQERHSIVGDVRGRGLMWSVELVGNNKEPATERMDAILEHLKEDGFLVGKTGSYRNVLTLMPPLIVSENQLEELLGALDKALS